jgi:hypothetical protein
MTSSVAREGVHSVVRAVEENGLAIDALVNNAGFGLAGPFAELDVDKRLAMETSTSAP